jgi:hypothetical protein
LQNEINEKKNHITTLNSKLTEKDSLILNLQKSIIKYETIIKEQNNKFNIIEEENRILKEKIINFEESDLIHNAKSNLLNARKIIKLGIDKLNIDDYLSSISYFEEARTILLKSLDKKSNLQ